MQSQKHRHLSSLTWPFRIRKIKCDETRPSCHRCLSTGRRCDGPRPTTIIVFQPDKSHSQRPAITRTSQIDFEHSFDRPEELRAFAFYLKKVAPVLAGGLDEGLWDILAPQLSRSDSAVRYCLLAISQFIEHPIRSQHNGQLSISRPSQKHLTALRWHGKALAAGRAAPDSSYSRTLLVKCVLFATLEFQQCNFRAGLDLLRTGYEVVAPTLTASDTNIQNPVLRTILPMCMRSACLLFTSWDGLYIEFSSSPNLAQLQTAVFRGLCTVYANLKDTYLARKSGVATAIDRLKTIRLRLVGLICTLYEHARANPLEDQGTLHTEVDALQDYCKIALTWLEAAAGSSVEALASILPSILDRVIANQQEAPTRYPAASRCSFFTEMTVIPIAYMVAIFAPDAALRTKALEVMHCKTIERPNTQLHAIVTYLGDIANLADPIPSFQVYAGQRDQEMGLEKVYDIRIKAPGTVWQLHQDDSFVLVAKQQGKRTARDAQFALIAGDMNGLYEQRCQPLGERTSNEYFSS